MYAPDAPPARGGSLIDAFVPRRLLRRLGLGAKYISHAQAGHLGVDEQKFQKKLKAGKDGKEPAKAAKKGAATADESGSEEEESRASQFKSKGLPNKAAVRPAGAGGSARAVQAKPPSGAIAKRRPARPKSMKK